jgi:cell division septation protein DedD
MASGGKRGSAGERVLESRHVIGLFMLMLLFSGVFFTLGYVMGRNQYDGQVRAATDPRSKPELPVLAKNEAASKRGNHPVASDTPTETTAPPNSDWEFYHAGDRKKTEDHLKPAMPASAAASKSAPVLVKTSVPNKAVGSPSKSLNAPLIPGGTYSLQVAALTKEADALELATRLQKKRFPAFVLSPQADKYFRVQVGPYVDQKSADAARKGLESAGFKAIVKH